LFTYRWLFIFLSPLFLLAFYSCNEDTILNARAVPSLDTVYTIETTATVNSKSYLDDTIITSLTISGFDVNHAVGVLTADEYSGNTRASFVFQVIPPSAGYSFPRPPDSAILILPYSGFAYGDTTNVSTQWVEVQELTSEIFKDTSYYSSSTYSSGGAISRAPVVIDPLTISDSVLVGTDYRAPHLRIRMSDDFVNRFKTEAVSGNSNFATYAAFLKWFKGVAVKPVSTSGSFLPYFQINGSSDFGRANILFYYTDTSANVQTVSFPFDPSYCAHFNKVERLNYQGLANELISSTATSDSIFIIQNEPGSVANLRFTGLQSLPKGLILKAELVINQIPASSQLPGDNFATYTGPERLFPIGIDDDGSAYTVLDREPSSSSEPLRFIDGKRRSVDIDGDGTIDYSYVINIPREVQKAITDGKDVLHLRVGGASGFPGAFRLLAAGSTYSRPAFRVRLNIVYSKI
jgi:hypothetical protein